MPRKARKHCEISLLTHLYRLAYITSMKPVNNRENILRCALALFSEKGYDAVSVTEIVEMAEITKPTLYYFFKSKEGLFRYLLQINYQKLQAALSSVCNYTPNPENYNQDVYPVLQHVVKAYFIFAQNNPQFYLMLLSLTFAPPTSQPAVWVEEYHKPQFFFLENLFRQFSQAHPCLQNNEIPAAGRFLALINAQICFWYRGYASIEQKDVDSIVRMFMHGVFS